LKTLNSKLALSAGRKNLLRKAVKAAGFTAVIGLTVWTAIMAKTAHQAPALMDVEVVSANGNDPLIDIAEEVTAGNVGDTGDTAEATTDLKTLCSDSAVRWFNGRPAKPARVITMTVTAYSPDAASCGDSADGLTATLHSVETNDFHLVAADPTLLPYGSMLSIEGYSNSEIVPVLDCGGAIKGRHIDVLFPTDAQARQWGVKQIKVIVWKYVDGGPADNPRKLR
jgi:3D (Asp-Asp-Asp) domain-containing protein